MIEEIAFGEMGMLEEDFNNSTPLYFVRRLNGMRAAEYSRQKLDMILARKIAYFASIGNFEQGTTEKDLWAHPFEMKNRTDELVQIMNIIESYNWKTPPIID